MAVQVLALMDLVLEVAAQALAFKDKVIKVVSISNLVKGITQVVSQQSVPTMDGGGGHTEGVGRAAQVSG